MAQLTFFGKNTVASDSAVEATWEVVSAQLQTSKRSKRPDLYSDKN